MPTPYSLAICCGNRCAWASGARTLKDDWKKLTNKYPRYSGIPLPVTTITEILDENDKLWTDMMDKTEQRFGLVALMIARLADGSLTLDQVPDLLTGDDLLTKLEAIPAPAAA